MKLCEDKSLRKPQCYIMKKYGSRYQVKKTDGTRLRFLKDCLKVSHDDIFNLLVDAARIDATVIAKDDDIFNLFKKPLSDNMSFIKEGIGYNYYR